MTSSGIYRAHHVSDVLNLLPTLFGFVPRESFIGVCLMGERRRFGFRLRVDLPAADDLAEVSTMIAGHLDRGEGERLLLIGVSDDPLRARRMVEAVHSSVSTAVDLALWATDHRWWEMGHAEPRSWLRDGAHEAVVSAVCQGQVIHPDRASVAAEFEPAAIVVDDVTIERAKQDLQARVDSSGLARTTMGEREVDAALEAHSAGETLSGERLVTVALWLRDLLVRDHFWFRIHPGNARQMLTWWLSVARVVPGRLRSAPLCLVSFAAWQLGDGARALMSAEAAIEEDAGYSMANLMLQVIEQALPPVSWEAIRLAHAPDLVAETPDGGSEDERPVA